jgi:hypothetical protein
MNSTSVFALALLAVPALAQPYGTSWVSHSGVDTGTCGLVANPCKSFQIAIQHTNMNGIVKALDAGEYGPIILAIF